MEPDKIIADIIQNEMQIPADRIVVYNQDRKAPRDRDIYITISTRKGKILGSKRQFNYNTLEEEKYVVMYQQYDIDISSKSRDALERKEEIVMAITSQYGLEKQNENTIRIFRIGNILDLSLVEGSGALHRYRIPLIITYIKSKQDSVAYYDKFRPIEEEIE